MTSEIGFSCTHSTIVVHVCGRDSQTLSLIYMQTYRNEFLRFRGRTGNFVWFLKVSTAHAVLVNSVSQCQPQCYETVLYFCGSLYNDSARDVVLIPQTGRSHQLLRTEMQGAYSSKVLGSSTGSVSYYYCNIGNTDQEKSRKLHTLLPIHQQSIGCLLYIMTQIISH